MKRFYFFFVLIVFIWGCSSSFDVSSLSQEERLNYAISLYNEKSYEDAINEFQSIIIQFPGSPVVDDAQFHLGMCYFKREQFILSAFEFSRLIRDMPASEFVSEAQYMLAESYYNLSPVYHLDQRYTKKSVEEFQAFIDFFPGNPKVADAEEKIKTMNEKLALKEYSSAVIYEKMEYYNAALKYYDMVKEFFHDTKYAPMASYRKILILRERKRFSEALREIESFIAKYPSDPNIAEVKKYERELGNS